MLEHDLTSASTVAACLLCVYQSILTVRANLQFFIAIAVIADDLSRATTQMARRTDSDKTAATAVFTSFHLDLPQRFSPWVLPPVVYCTIQWHSRNQACIGYTRKNTLVKSRQALLIGSDNSRVARIVAVVQ